MRHSLKDATPSATDPFTSLPRRTLMFGVLTLVALIFLPSLFFGFVYDDHWTFIGNGFLRSPEDLAVLFSHEAVARNVPDAFRPTLVLFDLATYQLWGVHPLPHHALSIVLYLASCFLVERWLRSLNAPLPLRITTMGLWGLMAIHAEVVAVISYREDLLAGILGLLACVLANRALRTRGNQAIGLAAFALLSMLAATGAKLSAAPLPAVWLMARLLDPWRTGTGDETSPPLQASAARVWLVALALGLGVAVMLAHRIAVYGDLSPYEGERDPHLHAHRVGMSAALAASVQIHLGYIAQVFTGIGLSPEYVDFGARWGELETVLATTSLASLLGYGIHSAVGRRRPTAALAICGAFVLAIPTSNLIPMPNMRADRFMLLPSIPMAIGLAASALAFGRWLAARTRPMWSIAPILVIAVVQGSLAQAAITAYRSDSRLWEVARKRAPHSARAHAISGELLIARMHGSEALAADPGVRARASAWCANAVRIDPLYDVGHLCQARLATLDRDWLAADHHFSRALELVPRREDRVLAALASVSLDRPDLPYPERIQRAFAYLDRALREYPYVAEVVATAARIEHRLGRSADAAAHYQRASQLHPERWDLVLSRLELLLDLGHPSAARKAYDAAEDLLREAPASRRDAVFRRLTDAEQLFTPSPFDADPRLESPFHES